MAQKACFLTRTFRTHRWRPGILPRSLFYQHNTPSFFNIPSVCICAFVPSLSWQMIVSHQKTEPGRNDETALSALSRTASNGTTPSSSALDGLCPCPCPCWCLIHVSVSPFSDARRKYSDCGSHASAPPAAAAGSLSSSSSWSTDAYAGQASPCSPSVCIIPISVES